jgi:hypothetical protein
MGPLVLLSCALLAGAPPAPAALPTISIDLAPLDRPTFEALERAGIYQGLVVRLVTERVALVDPKERADLVLRMERAGPEELLVTATGAGGARSRRVSIRALEDEDVRLRLVHVAADLVRQVRELPEPPRPTPAPASAPPPAPGPPRLRARLGLEGGLLWSGARPGALVRLAGATPVGPGEVGLGLVLHRPSPRSGLEVTEWGLFGVAGTGERALGARLRLAAGVDVGLWQHRWSYGGASGARLDVAALLHGKATFRLAPAWRLGLAGGLLVGREREHRTTTQVLWHAPAVRPFAGLELGFGREAGN